MPWIETEQLFKSTFEAVLENTSSDDEMSRAPSVRELGEAGRQEVWGSGSKYLAKTIAKHGGKRLPSARSVVSAIVPDRHSCNDSTQV
jgi:hypothetical protein